jgi:hypothetical protein
MMKEDWREWVLAVKKEIESWHLFDAAKVVAYDDMERGATIIPLGELFTRKRCGKYKFRQIAMGNMLKKGRDYGETALVLLIGCHLRKRSEGMERNNRLLAVRTGSADLCLPSVPPWVRGAVV